MSQNKVQMIIELLTFFRLKKTNIQNIHYKYYTTYFVSVHVDKNQLTGTIPSELVGSSDSLETLELRKSIFESSLLSHEIWVC